MNKNYLMILTLVASAHVHGMDGGSYIGIESPDNNDTNEKTQATQQHVPQSDTSSQKDGGAQGNQQTAHPLPDATPKNIASTSKKQRLYKERIAQNLHRDIYDQGGKLVGKIELSAPNAEASYDQNTQHLQHVQSDGNTRFTYYNNNDNKIYTTSTSGGRVTITPNATGFLTEIINGQITHDQYTNTDQQITVEIEKGRSKIITTKEGLQSAESTNIMIREFDKNGKQLHWTEARAIDKNRPASITYDNGIRNLHGTNYVQWGGVTDNDGFELRICSEMGRPASITYKNGRMQINSLDGQDLLCNFSKEDVVWRAAKIIGTGAEFVFENGRLKSNKKVEIYEGECAPSKKPIHTLEPKDNFEVIVDLKQLGCLKWYIFDQDRNMVGKIESSAPNAEASYDKNTQHLQHVQSDGNTLFTYYNNDGKPIQKTSTSRGRVTITSNATGYLTEIINGQIRHHQYTNTDQQIKVETKDGRSKIITTKEGLQSAEGTNITIKEFDKRGRQLHWTETCAIDMNTPVSLTYTNESMKVKGLTYTNESMTVKSLANKELLCYFYKEGFVWRAGKTIGTGAEFIFEDGLIRSKTGVEIYEGEDYAWKKPIGTLEYKQMDKVEMKKVIIHPDMLDRFGSQWQKERVYTVKMNGRQYQVDMNQTPRLLMDAVDAGRVDIPDIECAIDKQKEEERKKNPRKTKKPPKTFIKNVTLMQREDSDLEKMKNVVDFGPRAVEFMTNVDSALISLIRWNADILSIGAQKNVTVQNLGILKHLRIRSDKETATLTYKGSYYADHYHYMLSKPVTVENGHPCLDIKLERDKAVQDEDEQTVYNVRINAYGNSVRMGDSSCQSKAGNLEDRKTASQTLFVDAEANTLFVDLPIKTLVFKPKYPYYEYRHKPQPSKIILCTTPKDTNIMVNVTNANDPVFSLDGSNWCSASDLSAKWDNDTSTSMTYRIEEKDITTGKTKEFKNKTQPVKTDSNKQEEHTE